jgi:TRAP transporter 4TM/12TM fusion protein
MDTSKTESFLEAFLSEERISIKALYALFVSCIAVTLALYHLFTAYYGEPTSLAHRSLFVTFILVLIFLVYPLGGGSWSERSNWFILIDFAFITCSIAIEAYILYDIDAFQLRWGVPTRIDVIVGSVAIFLVLEASRRAVGWPMVIIASFFMLHTVFGNYFPGVLHGAPTPWSSFVDWIFMQDTGIFGIPIMVMSSFIILFLIFGSLLIRSGAGTFFINLANALAGRMTGGPAKTAVLSSAMMGTLSGSGVANVVATGSFTIPLMKSLGYGPVFAGAVEAMASTGGILMPPIMGAAAFLIAQFLSLPYLRVCIHALLPAIFYFWSVMAMVHFEAKKLGLKPLPKEEMPSLRKVIARGGHLLFSVFGLIAFLSLGYTAMMAAFWAILLIFLLSFVRKETRLSPVYFLSALEEGSKSCLTVGMACACAGIIIGCVYVSGLGMRFSNILVMAAGGKLWLTLIFVMIASIILGMGMPVTAVYLTLVTIVVPALIDLGVDPVAAHLFCFYFGCISNITPPVCLAAFAAAGVSGANPMKTGFTAVRIGIAAFLIPFMFIYEPAMLMKGSGWYILWIAFTALCGIVSLAAGVQGWLLRRAMFPERAALILSALVLIKSGLITDIIGFGLMGFTLVIQKWFSYSEAFEQRIISPFVYLKSECQKFIAKQSGWK